MRTLVRESGILASETLYEDLAVQQLYFLYFFFL